MEVTIDLPCDPMVKAYIEYQLPRTGSALKLTQTNMIGRIIMQQLDGKRAPLLRDGYERRYKTAVRLVINYEMMKRGMAGIDHRRVREVNELMRQHIRELAFNTCIGYLRVNPSGNIRSFMGEWLEANGLYQDTVSLDHMLRSFFNWRKRHHPDSLRHRGRYHNYKNVAS